MPELLEIKYNFLQEKLRYLYLCLKFIVIRDVPKQMGVFVIDKVTYMCCKL